MLYSEVEDSLSHIGVKGMRWGHRKAEGSTSAGPDHATRVADSNVYRGKVRAARKVVLGEALTYAKTHKGFNSISAGTIAVGTILGGPAGALGFAGGSASANILRSQGYSRGKSLALGYLGGPVGAVVATEIAARKLAKASN